MAEGLTAVQEHENELAEVVVVCEPEQASLMMGGLHPRGSLFERPVNIVQAKAQHAAFRDAVRGDGGALMDGAAWMMVHPECPRTSLEGGCHKKAHTHARLTP